MSPEPIEDLLRDADRAAGRPPDGPADLAGRVLRTVRRRRRIRNGVRAGAVVSVLAIATVLFVTRPDLDRASIQPPAIALRPDGEDQIARLRAEIARLGAEADAAAALAKRMSDLKQRHARLGALRRKLRQPDPLEQARREVGRTPFIIVYQADRMYRELELHASAAKAYRRAIDLFPDSPWAQVARGRLSEMENSEGDLL